MTRELPTLTKVQSNIAIRALLISFIGSMMLIQPAVAGSCSNNLASLGVTILNNISRVIPIFGAIMFVYASARYGTTTQDKQTYKDMQKNALIYAIIVPIVATTVITGVIKLTGMEASGIVSCLSS